MASSPRLLDNLRYADAETSGQFSSRPRLTSPAPEEIAQILPSHPAIFRKFRFCNSAFGENHLDAGGVDVHALTSINNRIGCLCVYYYHIGYLSIFLIKNFPYWLLFHNRYGMIFNEVSKHDRRKH